METEQKNKDIADILLARKDVRKLVDKSNECYARMDFVGAMKYRAQIKEIIDRESSLLLTRKESVIDMVGKSDDGTKLKVLTYLHSMTCMADVFNGLLIDFKDLIKSLSNNSKFVRFDNLDRLMEECKKEVDYLTKDMSRSFQIAFATRSDEMREVIEEMVRNDIKKGTDRFEREADMAKEEDRERIERFNKEQIRKDILEDIRVGDMVISESGMGKVIQVGELGDSVMVKSSFGKEILLKVEDINEIFREKRG